ncbi:zinc finger CCCH domain-containing protein 18 isoform X2 [Dendroctonus ponderosae]|uniref:zinc finger CCCH domain-containing protein 18 isoform X2 n=1 Tax=Dendroctonus ponderosae TaxID=77166 RepID=UPI00203528FE|nr:zinc finger CCCH domain-containing protein 18 isoform X2 [Dendroctonus ponderosae]
MPVVDSDDSRSGSSSNESDNEEVRSRNNTRSPSGSSRPQSPASGPQTPRSNRSRNRESGSRSRSTSPKSPLNVHASENGPQSPKSPSPDGIRSRSNSGSSYGGSPSPSSPQNSRPPSPKSPDSGQSRPHSRGSVGSSPPRAGNQSRSISRDNSAGRPFKGPRGPRSPEELRNTRQGSGSGDNASVRSASSDGSRKSTRSRGSRKSKGRSSSRSSSRGSGPTRRRSRSGSDSDSSVSSVDSSSRKNKDISRSADTKPEDISDGDMESDQEKPAVPVEKAKKPDINISHEDLSDVSDLEDSMGGTFDEEDEIPKDNKEEAQKSSETEKVLADELKSAAGDKKVSEASLGTARPDENEEQLDFEAEDGECDDVKSKDGDKEEKEEGEEDGEAVPPKEEKELEEGEVSDEDDARPEETEPRPVCRFFSRGACTWGASCRFLHPGVTDKGNYTMFDMVRPMLPGEYGMGRMADERLYKPEPPLVESAWERGLRTAKEMLKKSMRRKEQDIDFEEKKMNLSIAQEEFDKENGYYGRVPSPEPRYVRHLPEYSVPRPPPEEYYSRRPIVYEPEYAPIRREHPRPYREMPPPRGPPPEYYPPKYEEEPPPRPHERPEVRERERERRKPKREVIVQRAEKEERPARADDWQDPWMRSKSPGRRKDRKRSYSSGSSSYSSSSSRSSSPSSKSSYRSRSRSAYRKERSGSVQRGGRHVSPSVIVSERKAANERAALMNPPAPKRRAPSPGMMRVSAAANPPAPSREDIGQARSKLAVAAALVRAKGKSKRSVKSSSGSSSGSSSESDSSESSSSSSRSNSTPVRDARKASEFVKAIDALKGGAIGKNKIKLNLKNPPGVRKAEPRDARKAEAAGKKRAPTSPPQGDVKAKKATSRREELLKQLKAVEDAIAKKRSKV